MRTFRFVLIGIFTCLSPVHAERLPSFDMDTCVGEATAIVQGNLDSKGELEVKKIISGPSKIAQHLKIDVGSYEAESFQKLVGGGEPFEVVAFLTKKNGEEWGLALQYAGMVGFKEQAVFLMEDNFMGSWFEKDKSFTKDGFFQALEGAISSGAELGQLIADPPTAERTKELIEFALQHGQANEEKDGVREFHPNFRLGRIAAALRNLTEDDQNILLHVLQQSTTQHDQIILLGLAEWIPLKDSALDKIAAFLPRNTPPMVREAAMDTLCAINGYKTVDYLIPYLEPDEPQLFTVLSDLGSLSFPPQDSLLNVHAVAALKKLADLMDGHDYIERGPVSANGAISHQLTHYLHPQLFPALYNFALHGDHAASAQSFSYLVEATGLKYTQEDKKTWENWWRKAQPLLEGNFDLQTVEGRELWMDHYAKADPATQKILINLWLFEPTVDEAALLESAMQNDSAKQVLSELWQRRRLSATTKKAIVQRFLTYKLVNDPPENAKTDKTLYGASLERYVTFPFPKAAEFHARMEITIGPQMPVFQDESWSIFCMGDSQVDVRRKPNNEGPGHSRRFSSPPQARAIVEYYESDFPHSHDILWKLRWNLGPIQLSNVGP